MSNLPAVLELGGALPAAAWNLPPSHVWLAEAFGPRYSGLPRYTDAWAEVNDSDHVPYLFESVDCAPLPVAMTEQEFAVASELPVPVSCSRVVDLVRYDRPVVAVAEEAIISAIGKPNPGAEFRKIAECPACGLSMHFDTINVITTCRHAMHTGCLLGNLESSAECPVCGGPFSLDDLGEAELLSQALKLFEEKRWMPARPPASSPPEAVAGDDERRGTFSQFLTDRIKAHIFIAETALKDAAEIVYAARPDKLHVTEYRERMWELIRSMRESALLVLPDVDPAPEVPDADLLNEKLVSHWMDALASWLCAYSDYDLERTLLDSDSWMKRIKHLSDMIGKLGRSRATRAYDEHYWLVRNILRFAPPVTILLKTMEKVPVDHSFSEFNRIMNDALRAELQFGYFSNQEEYHLNLWWRLLHYRHL